MTELTAEKRKEIPAKEFGLPGERAYPIEDKAHARNAKSRASMAEHEGHITPAQKAEIDRKADKKLKPLKEHQLPHWKEK